MSNITASTRSFSEIETLRAKWGWIVALGVIYSVAGFIALGSVLTATVASVFIVGIMMLIAGVAEVINAFQVKTWGKFLFWVLLGVLYIVAGFVTFRIHCSRQHSLRFCLPARLLSQASCGSFWVSL